MLIPVENNLRRISPRPYGTRGLLFNVTQDCAALVLGYLGFSLRENGRWLFHPPWVGEDGGRPTLTGGRIKLFSRVHGPHSSTSLFFEQVKKL